MPSTSLFYMIDSERLIHGVKTAFACVLGFIAAKLLKFPIDQWLIITILVVMCAQLSVGSMIQKSYSRFLGTLLGSLIAALTLYLFPQNSTANAIAISLAGAFFSYLATSESSLSDAGTLGAVTVTTILINQDPSITIAGERFVEISVGIMIAALVSQFILPIQAKSHLRRTQAKTILQLRNYYIASLMSEHTQENIEHYRYLDEEIVKSLSAQRKLAKQSKQEFFGRAFSQEIFTRLLQCEKELFRSMLCMHYALKMIPSGRTTLLNNPEVQKFNKGIESVLEQLAPCFMHRKISKTSVAIPSLPTLKQAIIHIRAQASEEDTIYIDGFLFGAELLTIQLVELVVIIKKMHK